jgi:hypothetical protein
MAAQGPGLLTVRHLSTTHIHQLRSLRLFVDDVTFNKDVPVNGPVVRWGSNEGSMENMGKK